MRWLTLPALLAAFALAAGCGGDDVADDVAAATEEAAGLTDELAETGEALLEEGQDLLEQAATIELTEQSGSGVSGTATVIPVSESETRIELELAGGDPSDEPRPAHVHTGTCADLDPTPAYPLENVQDGRSETTVDVSAVDLLAEPHAINVHRSEDDAATYVACGEIALR